MSIQFLIHLAHFPLKCNKRKWGSSDPLAPTLHFTWVIAIQLCRAQRGAVFVIYCYVSRAIFPSTQYKAYCMHGLLDKAIIISTKFYWDLSMQSCFGWDLVVNQKPRYRPCASWFPWRDKWDVGIFFGTKAVTPQTSKCVNDQWAIGHWMLRPFDWVSRFLGFILFEKIVLSITM